MTQFSNPRPGDHDEAQALLPWYVTGAIDADDRARVETHLAACPQCQAELALERRLAGEVAALSIGVEQGWAMLRPRLTQRPRRPGLGGVLGALAEFGATARRAVGASPPWVGWALAAQVGALAILAVLVHPPAQAPAYRALGAAPAPANANLLVIFRPDIREASLRQAVRDVDGRIVGGPTAADAYLMHVPAATRGAALARLHARADIEMAEPIDSGASR